ncbi:hypothetical protein QOT17_015332 [Balamuthia mandrillaris]
MSTRPAVQYAPMPHGDSKEQCTEALLPPRHHRAGTRKNRRTTCRLRWNLPPALGCIPEQPDSTARLAVIDRHPHQASTGLSPSAVPRSRGLPACDSDPTSRALRLQFQTAVRPCGF